MHFIWVEKLKTFKFPVKYDVHVVTKWQLNKIALQYSTFLALLKLKKYMYMQEYTCNLRYLNARYKHHFPLIDSPLSGGDGEVSMLSFNFFLNLFLLWFLCSSFAIRVIQKECMSNLDQTLPIFHYLYLKIFLSQLCEDFNYVIPQLCSMLPVYDIFLFK